MAVELATGYISLVPSAQGIADKIAKELDLDSVAQTQGKAAGEKLSSGLLAGAADIGKDLAAKLGLVAVAALAIKSAEDIESAQNIIIRSTGATGKAAEGLEESFRNVASGTSASFETVAQTMSELYQRTGLQGEALEGLTGKVLSFNRQFKDSPITVDEFTTAVAGFNVPGKEMGTVLDHLFQISQQTGVPLGELLQQVSDGGPILRGFGFDIEFSAGFLGQLNKAGLDANQILPGLKRVLTEAGQAGKDPAVVLRDLVTQLDGLVQKGDILGARQLAVQVFGPRGSGLIDAVVAGKLSLQDLNTTLDVTGDGIEETGKKTGTLSGALGVLKNNLQLALAEFATPAIDAANEALRGVLPIIRDVGDEFASLPDPVKIGALAVIGFVASLDSIGNAAQGLASVGSVAKSAGAQAADAFDTIALKALYASDAMSGVSTVGFIVGGGLLAAAAAGVIAFGAFLATASSADKAREAGQKWAEQVVKDAGSIDDAGTRYQVLRDKLGDVRSRLEEVTAAQKAYSDQAKADGSFSPEERERVLAYATQIAGLKGKYDELAPSVAASKDSADRAESGVSKLNSAVEHGTSAADAYTVANKETKQALDDLQDSLLGAAGAQISYERAVIAVETAQVAARTATADVATAQANYNQAVEDYGPTSQEAAELGFELAAARAVERDANLDLREAQLQAASASIDLTDKERALLSAADATTGGVEAQIAKLRDYQAQNPEAAASVDVLIGKLVFGLKPAVDNLPTVHNTDMNVNIGPAMENIAEVLFAISLIEDKTVRVRVEADVASAITSGVLTRQSGGPVPGAIGQPVPLIAHGGEYMLSADIVDRIKQGRPSEGAAAFDAPAPFSDAAPGGRTVHVENLTMVYDGLDPDEFFDRVLAAVA